MKPRSGTQLQQLPGEKVAVLCALFFSIEINVLNCIAYGTRSSASTDIGQWTIAFFTCLEQCAGAGR